MNSPSFDPQFPILRDDVRAPGLLRRSLTAAADGAGSLVVRPLRRVFNVTFLLYALIVTLVTIGVVFVYSSSAAIAAYRENRQVRLTEKSKEEPQSSIAALLSEQQAPPGLIELLSEPDSPSYHSAAYLKRQVAWAVMGLFGLFFFYSIDYHRWLRWAPHLLALSFCALVGVWMPGFGLNINGASRWVHLGPVSMQPSELAKLSMVIFMARQLSLHRGRLRSFMRGFVPHILVLGIIAATILKEPDLGATACLCLIVVTMLYAAGARLTHLGLLALSALPVVALELAVPYRRARLLAFLDPEKYFHSFAWQLNQSLIAIGSGGMTGQGIGAGPQKYQFLSTAFSDFIFAIVCEETGFVGACLILALFLALFLVGWLVAYRAPDMSGMLVGIGITSMFAISAFIHVMVNTGMVPTKGLTLPFISAGGSSLFINLMAGGILLNVAKQGELHRALEQGEVAALTPNRAASDTGQRRLWLRREGVSREVPFAPRDLPQSPERN